MSSFLRPARSPGSAAQRRDDLGRLVDRERRLRDIRELRVPGSSSALDVGDDSTSTIESGASPIVPTTSSCPAWPIEHDRVALGGVAARLDVNLRHERARGVDRVSARAAALSCTDGATPCAERTTVAPSGTSSRCRRRSRRAPRARGRRAGCGRSACGRRPGRRRARARARPSRPPARTRAKAPRGGKFRTFFTILPILVVVSDTYSLRTHVWRDAGDRRKRHPACDRGRPVHRRDRGPRSDRAAGAAPDEHACLRLPLALPDPGRSHRRPGRLRLRGGEAARRPSLDRPGRDRGGGVSPARRARPDRAGEAVPQPLGVPRPRVRLGHRRLAPAGASERRQHHLVGSTRAGGSAGDRPARRGTRPRRSRSPVRGPVPSRRRRARQLAGSPARPGVPGAP